MYLSFLNPKCEFLFQRPRRASKAFLLDEPETTVLYETTKIGVNMVGQMLRSLTELLSIEKKYTNHSMRATGIMLLKEAKIGDRDIQKLTGHKDERSLNNYDHTNSVSNKADMAAVLLMAKKRKRHNSDDQENCPPSPPAKMQKSPELLSTAMVLLPPAQQSPTGSKTVASMVDLASPTPGPAESLDAEDGFRGFRTQPPRKQPTATTVSRPTSGTSPKTIQLPTCSTSTSPAVSMSPPQMSTNVEAQKELSMDMKFFQDYLLREQQIRAAETQIRAADSHRQSDMQAELLKMMNTVIDRLPPPKD